MGDLKDKPQTRPWIAYVGPLPFPEGKAGSRRMLGNALAIALSERNVVVVSGLERESGDVRRVAAGIDVVEVNERLSEHLPKAVRYALYARMGHRTRDWIEAQNRPPEAIIIYSGYLPYLLTFTGWARKSGIPVIFDAVEWYAAESPLRFAFSPYLWSTELAMRVMIPRIDGVVAISRALETYYRGRGTPVLRVPPLIDTAAYKVRDPGSAGPLRLSYAGSPGSKDLLDPIVAAVLAVDQGRGVLRLEIAGLDEPGVRGLAALNAWRDAKEHGLPECLRAHGTLSHAETMALVGACDFSIFIRNINRVSTYGFPTKFVESLTMGTPVIANLTSDLSEYLRDGETGFVCRHADRSSVEDALRRALALSRTKLANMRRNARAEAERSFDYRNLSDSFDAFFQAIAQNGTQSRRTLA